MNLESDSAREAFADKIWRAIRTLPSSRGIFWVPDAQTVEDAAGLPFLGLSSDGRRVTAGLSNARIVQGLLLEVSNGATLGLSGTELTLTDTGIGFSGSNAPEMRPANSGQIQFDGARRGCLEFSTYIKRQSLNDDWNWGFQFVISSESSITGFASEWLPLASTTDGSADMIGFAASFDPADPCNAEGPINGTAGAPLRSALQFTGENLDSSATALASGFRTMNGDYVKLYPVGTHNEYAERHVVAALAFAPGPDISDSREEFHASPVGDFLIEASTGPNGVSCDLLCGLSAAEFISVVPGDLDAPAGYMRFTPYKPAYCAVFPPSVASPTGRPAATASLLQDGYQTSWVSVLPFGTASAATYVSQPRGSALFGYDPYVWKSHPELLGHVDTGVTLPADGSVVFPMVPYSGFAPSSIDTQFDQPTSRTFEGQIVAATRREQIGVQTGANTLAARASAAGLKRFDATSQTGAKAGQTNVTTPSGVITTIDAETAEWLEILLAQITTPEVGKLSFEGPTDALQKAFQTNKLLMVAANAQSFVTEDGQFNNALNIGGWTLAADVGQSPDYGDYANVMIVKALPGKLYDPEQEADLNLVANPARWTQAETFAAPTTGEETTPDTAQLTMMSQWLQDYFQAAQEADDDEYFGAFNDIACDENWTGILILRAKISSPPSDLAGIAAGVRDPDSYYAHHLAIKISQIRSDPDGGGISIEGQSSVSGLIYYEDSAYDSSAPTDPVVPQPSLDYDFVTLSLKVLFENTAVKNFSSYTQLSAQTLFGSTVTDMGDGGNAQNAIIMAGTFQDNGGTPTYGMKMIQDYVFNMTNNVLREVETVSAEMVTISVEEDLTRVRFVLNGFLGFHVLQMNDGATAVDYFSYGNEETANGRGVGLSYSSLGIAMSFNTPDPAEPPAAVTNREITFDSSQMTFNTAISEPREGSLASSLSLELVSFVIGPANGESPSSLGYLDVVTEMRVASLGEIWNALRFRLNLGTAGELAGKLGLNAYLLLAWSPDSTAGPDVNGITSYNASVTLQMPGTNNGAPLISLQSVLSMSYGMIQLLYQPGNDFSALHPATRRRLSPARTESAETERQFLLLLNEIAIQFMGILKLPPNGNTAFYLFGSSDSDAGLGWYAAYTNNPEDDDDEAERRLVTAGSGRDAQ